MYRAVRKRYSVSSGEPGVEAGVGGVVEGCSCSSLALRFVEVWWAAYCWWRGCGLVRDAVEEISQVSMQLRLQRLIYVGVKWSSV